MRIFRTLLLLCFCAYLPVSCGTSTKTVTITTGSATGSKEIQASIQPAPELVFEDPPRTLQAGAKLTLEKLEHQFGQVPDKARLEYDFKFRNGGDKDLEILTAKASCGCTTPTLTKNVYAPGEEGELKVVWETKGHGGQSKSLDVTWREKAEEGRPAGQTQNTKLYIRATILPFLSCTPPRLDFGQLQRDEIGEVFVDVVSKDPDFQILSIDPTQVGAMATDLKGEVVSPPANGKARLRFTYRESTPSFGPRQLIPRMSIRTLGTAPGDDQPKERTHEIGGVVLLYTTITCEPPMFAVGKVSPKGSFVREVILKSPSGTPFDVISTEILRSNVPGFQVRAERLPQATHGESFKVILTGDVGSHMGLVDGQVLVQTDLPEDQRISISLRGMVRN